MKDKSDILRDSRSWARLTDGIHRKIQPEELRDYLHDIANVLTTLVASVNDALDETDALQGKTKELGTENKWVFRAVVTGLVGIAGSLLLLYVTTSHGAGA